MHPLNKFKKTLIGMLLNYSEQIEHWICNRYNDNLISLSTARPRWRHLTKLSRSHNYCL